MRPDWNHHRLNAALNTLASQEVRVGTLVHLLHRFGIAPVGIECLMYATALTFCVFFISSAVNRLHGLHFGSSLSMYVTSKLDGNSVPIVINFSMHSTYMRLFASNV